MNKLAALLGILILPPAFAATSIEDKHLPRGVTVHSANALAQKLDKASLQFERRDAAPRRRLEAALAAAHKPYVDRLNAALARDPRLRAEYERYLAAQNELIQNKRLTPAAKGKRLAENSQRNEALFERLMRAGRIDMRSFQADTMKTLQNHGGGKKFEITYSRFLTVFWRERPSGSLPQEYEQELTAPYPLRQTRNEGGDTRVNLEEGKFVSNTTVLFVGGQTNEAGLGHFARVPAGYSKIRVSARLPETYHYQSAVGFLAASGSVARSRIVVISEDEQVCTRDYEHGNLLSIAAWYAEVSGEDTVVMSCEINAPPANQDIAIQFVGRTNGWALGVGGLSYTTVSAQPDVIRIRYIP